MYVTFVLVAVGFDLSDITLDIDRISPIGYRNNDWFARTGAEEKWSIKILIFFEKWDEI